MKIIGKAKGKAPKSWCLIRNNKTGHYYVGYDGDWPAHGPLDKVQQAVDIAKDYIAKTPRPKVLPKVDFPGHMDWRQKLEDMPVEYREKRAAYDLFAVSESEARKWDGTETKSQLEPLDYMPVFESGLRFLGYTRGRSSVTMQFEADNGQIIEFGPSGIDGLIQGIIDGRCPNVELEGTYEEKEWLPNEQKYKVIANHPRGKGIHARFKFAKKGQNTYAELTEE